MRTQNAQTVLACCGRGPILGSVQDGGCTMGVDTGKDLHVVISRRLERPSERREVVYLGVEKSYADLDWLMKRLRVRVRVCVVDALPEIHATRELAGRHPGNIWLKYFVQGQKGEPKWDNGQQIVQENRTEALDLSRAAIRNGTVVLPRRSPLVEEFAAHIAANAKRLIEDEETGAQSYR